MTWYGQELRSDKISSRRLHTLRECPKTFISQFSHDVIRLYNYTVQFNALPEAGGINDQIAVVMTALSVVRDEMNKVEAWRLHEATQKTKKTTDSKDRPSRRKG